jgi:hypothetical protein
MFPFARQAGAILLEAKPHCQPFLLCFLEIESHFLFKPAWTMTLLF